MDWMNNPLQYSSIPSKPHTAWVSFFPEDARRSVGGAHVLLRAPESCCTSKEGCTICSAGASYMTWSPSCASVHSLRRPNLLILTLAQLWPTTDCLIRPLRTEILQGFLILSECYIKKPTTATACTKQNLHVAVRPNSQSNQPHHHMHMQCDKWLDR